MVTMTRELERGLIEAGVPEDQAREIVNGLELRLSELATREDLERELAAFRREIDARFEAVDVKLDALDDKLKYRFEALEARIDDLRVFLLRALTWGGGLLAALIGTLAYLAVR